MYLKGWLFKKYKKQRLIAQRISKNHVSVFNVSKLVRSSKSQATNTQQLTLLKDFVWGLNLEKQFIDFYRNF